ncbi:MAG: manganese-binding transcriptional regulator MntR [Phycisphaerales bacterium]|nr:manganese-binding transcriptional regulator MntR [Phycisphaerales bacterium]
MSPRTNSFAKTRRDHAVETAEDYVEAIEAILEKADRCRVCDLADQMQVSHVTVTRILTRLEGEGLVARIPYGPVELTRKGRRMAHASRTRHELMLALLLSIGVPESAANHDAEGMEHHASEQTLQAIRRFLESSQASGES